MVDQRYTRLETKSDEASSTGTLSEEAWWSNYQRLSFNSYSETAKSIIEFDSETIASTILDCQQKSSEERRGQTGIVVGAVQSGKTASMLGSIAKLLDRKVSIIVLLAGTRIALWRQTLERFIQSFDDPQGGDHTNSIRNRCLLKPPTVDVLDTTTTRSVSDYLNLTRTSRQMKRAFLKNKPIVLIIPKVEAHLSQLAKILEDAVSTHLNNNPDSLNMVVFDDEADDASVLDQLEGGKTIPRRIEQLWTGLTRHRTTLHENFKSTYVAYTATPQANFLQSNQNPLSPRDFCLALRFPYIEGNGPMQARTPTFSEPAGLKAYYCGGNIFYDYFGEISPFSTTVDYPEHDDPVVQTDALRRIDDEMIQDGVRAFLVAAAVRLQAHLKSGGIGYEKAAKDSELSKVDLQLLPDPHCALIHPSAEITDHFRERERLISWMSGVEDDCSASAESLSLKALANLIDEEPDRWKRWYTHFKQTQERIQTELPRTGFLSKFVYDDWIEIKRLMIERIVPYLSIKVINSDERADDAPNFKGRVFKSSTNSFSPPEDLLTVFISGNVMSRGITLEGLTTSVFLRSTARPGADTQMQMQRWFGYRGSIAPFLHLFTYADQLRLFKDYHSHDVLVRREILDNQNAGQATMPHLLLHARGASATTKCLTRRVPLHPGPSPIIGLIDPPNDNRHILQKLVSEHQFVPLPNNSDKGAIIEHPFSLADLAKILDDFEYSTHDPTTANEQSDLYTRWGSLAKQHNLAEGTCLFRPKTSVTPSAEMVKVGLGLQCPYNIAAYLRFWAQALDKSSFRGLCPTDKVNSDWRYVADSLTAPTFHIGIRSGFRSSIHIDEIQGITAVRRTALKEKHFNILQVLWGSNIAKLDHEKYYGDKRFDYHLTGRVPPPLPPPGKPLWRPRGHSGLLLFYAVEEEKAPKGYVLAAGLCLPHGGPDQIAALS